MNGFEQHVAEIDALKLENKKLIELIGLLITRLPQELKVKVLKELMEKQ